MAGKKENEKNEIVSYPAGDTGMDAIDGLIHGLIAVGSEIETEKKEMENPKPKVPGGLTEIEKEITEMLWENTGAHVLDSGFYGRHWEKNRKVKDFRKLPILEYDFWVDKDSGEISVNFSLNIFHFLKSVLAITDMSKAYDAMFKRFAKKYPYDSWLEIMENFVQYLSEKYGVEYESADNTYNYENILSQGLQYIIFRDSAATYIILQLHNGADIRGGYTIPRVFELTDYDRFIMGQTHVYAACDCMEIYSDDAGVHWYDYDGYNESENNNKIPKEWELKTNKRGEYLQCKRCGKKVKFCADI